MRALLVATLVLACVPVEPLTAQQSGLPPEVGMIPPDAVAAGWIRVGEVWKSGLGKILNEQAEFAKGLAEMEKKLGFTIGDIDRIVFAVTLPTDLAGGPTGMAFVTTTKPITRDKLLKAMAMDGPEQKHKGKSYFTSTGVPATELGSAVAFLSDRQFLAANPVIIRAALEREPNGKVAGTLGTALGRLATGKHTYAVALNPAAVLKQIANDLPPQAEPFKPLLQVEHATATLEMDATTRGEVILYFPKEDQARAAEKAANMAFDLLRPVVAQALATIPKEALDIPAAAKLIRDFEATIKNLKAQQTGTQVKVAINLNMNAPIMIGLLLPAVQKVREAANRTKSANNLKQLGLALHAYHDTFNQFPLQAIHGKDGKPLLSWRVALLPFVLEEKLYRQFKLDEPWDSAHNKKLLEKMPDVYAHPSFPRTNQGLTHYQVCTGPQTLFQGNTRMNIARIRDGTSNTLLVVEAADPVPWTKPADLIYDPMKPLPKLGGFFSGGSNALFADGAVFFLKSTVAEKVLRALITPAGGEVVSRDDL